MDSFFGFLVFVVIMAVVSIVRKMQEAKQEAARKEDTSLRREDLPEATRRRLYGEGPGGDMEVPVARPRTQAPVARPAAQEPESVYERSPAWELEMRDENAAAGWEKSAQEDRRVPWEEAEERPVPAPPQRRAPIPVQQRPRLQQPAPPRAEDPLRQAREVMEQILGRSAPPQEPARPLRPQRERRPAAQRPQPPASAPKPAQTQAAQARPQAPVVPKAERAKSREFYDLITDMDSVRRGIVLLEVLGPPKALQDS